jgi:predicted RNase H-like HicB family nuclease
MNEYLVVIERSKDNFSAYSPDLPGCIAAGSTKEETLDLMRQAITLHLGGLKEDGLAIPTPSSTAEYLAV